MLLARPTLFDPSRAPAGKHVAWAYCHFPNGRAGSALDRIEAQIEHFAPGLCDRVLARFVLGTADARQLLFHPVPRPDPSATPHPALFFSSASTPPGGVRGMCAFHAARSVLRRAKPQ